MQSALQVMLQQFLLLYGTVVMIGRVLCVELTWTKHWTNVLVYNTLWDTNINQETRRYIYARNISFLKVFLSFFSPV